MWVTIFILVIISAFIIIPQTYEEARDIGYAVIQNKMEQMLSENEETAKTREEPNIGVLTFYSFADTLGTSSSDDDIVYVVVKNNGYTSAVDRIEGFLTLYEKEGAVRGTKIAESSFHSYGTLEKDFKRTFYGSLRYTKIGKSIESDKDYTSMVRIVWYNEKGKQFIETEPSAIDQHRCTEFHDDFEDGDSNGWVEWDDPVHWGVEDENSRSCVYGENCVYSSNDTSDTNTNAYHSLWQNSTLTYVWVVKFVDGSPMAGMHIFASDCTLSQRGDSYLIWQDANFIRIYESVGNVLNDRADFPYPANIGEIHTYKVNYNPTTGTIVVWRDGVHVGNWTDSSPLLNGKCISLRTNSAHAHFDDIVVIDKEKDSDMYCCLAAGFDYNADETNGCCGDDLNDLGTYTSAICTENDTWVKCACESGKHSLASIEEYTCENCNGTREISNEYLCYSSGLNPEQMKRCNRYYEVRVTGGTFTACADPIDAGDDPDVYLAINQVPAPVNYWTCSNCADSSTNAAGSTDCVTASGLSPGDIAWVMVHGYGATDGTVNYNFNTSIS